MSQDYCFQSIYNFPGTEKVKWLYETVAKKIKNKEYGKVVTLTHCDTLMQKSASATDVTATIEWFATTCQNPNECRVCRLL